MARGLTLKERRFVDAFCGSCAGNGTKAVLASGYSSTTRSNVAATIAYELLRKPHIRQAIDRREAHRAEKTIADADERDKIVSGILRHGADPHRLKAAHELNKCSGRHSVKHVLDVTEKLSDIIAGSRS